MQKYTNLLALITLSTFCLHVEATDRPAQLQLTLAGVHALGISYDPEHPENTNSLITRSNFVMAFVSGVAKSSTATDEMLDSYISGMRDKQAVVQSLEKSISGLRQYNPNASLQLNGAGQSAFGVQSLQNSQIVELFLNNGGWSHCRTESEIQDKIKENFVINGSIKEKNASIQPLVQAVLEAQDNVGDVALLLSADHSAKQLLLLLSETPSKPVDESPIQEVKQPETPAQEVMVQQFRGSNKDTYIPNMQTLILDKVLQPSNVVYQDCEKIGIDFLKRFIKEFTKWVGVTTYTLDLNTYAPGNSVTLQLIRKLIMATIIVFDDPSCQFESNGSLVNNKAANMSLSDFLVKHLGCQQKKITNILSQASMQTSDTQRVQNLEALANQINN